MDDILLPMESELCLQQLYDEVTTTLQNHGLLVAPDKIQLKAPFNYLGHVMEESKIKPQKTQISMQSLCTLNDFQKLLLLLSRFSCVRLCATPITAAHQAPVPGFSRQEPWSRLPFPSPMHESEK